MEKSPSHEANSCSGTLLFLVFLRNLQVHCYFHHSLTHILSPNNFSHLSSVPTRTEWPKKMYTHFDMKNITL